MTVDFKSPVSSSNTNTAYMSRTDDTSTTGKINLLNTDSATITDIQSTYNNHKDSYVAHREFDTKANLIAWATTAVDGSYAFATDEQISYEVKSGVLSELGGAVPAHNDTTGKQGGTTGEYFHLTSAEETKVRTDNYTQTISDDFAIGDGTDTDKDITASNGDLNEPKLRYNSTTSKWQFSNDGTVFSDLGAGGGGVTVETAFFNNLTGLSSTNTKIPYYPTAIQDTTGSVVTISNSSTTGLAITAVVDCVVTGLYSYSSATIGAYGWSRSSSQLTTGIATINKDDRVGNDTMTTASFVSQCSVNIPLSAGQILRPHTNGQTPNNNIRLNLSFIAIAA